MSQQPILQTTALEEIEHIVREHLAAFARGQFVAWGALLAHAHLSVGIPDELAE